MPFHVKICKKTIMNNFINKNKSNFFATNKFYKNLFWFEMPQVLFPKLPYIICFKFSIYESQEL